MPKPLHILFRKLKTIRLIIARCANWPAILLAKFGIGPAPELLLFRDGFVLKPIQPLRATWGEIFEPAIADLYGIREASPDLIIDIGGNMGAFACRAAFLHPQARVHAFEPSEKHAARMAENVRLNNLRNVTIHQAPVTKDGREVMFAALGAGGSSGIFLHEGGTLQPLRSTTLADVPIGNAQALFVKLDCEGAEGEIVEWLCAHRAELPPQVQIGAELHHWCPVPDEEIVAQLQAHGFATEQKIMFDEPYLFASSRRV